MLPWVSPIAPGVNVEPYLQNSNLDGNNNENDENNGNGNGGNE